MIKRISSTEWEVKRYKALGISKPCVNHSYVIKDKERVIIDPILAESGADYIVIPSFIELEHLTNLNKDDKYIVTKSGKKILESLGEYDYMVVDYGDELDIGDTNLKFYCTDNFIVTYWIEHDILFSGELFSQYGVLNKYDESSERKLIMSEFKEFFANILLPYREEIKRIIEGLDEVKISSIFPSHGATWRKYTSEVLFKYRFWSSGDYKDTATIVYISIYQATELIAQALKNGLEEKLKVKVHKLNYSPVTEIMRDVLDSKFILVGSPIICNDIHPKVKFFLEYMKSLKPSNKKIATPFGSYDWNDEGKDYIIKFFEELGFKVFYDNILFTRFLPSKKRLEEIKEFAEKLADLSP
ncbi:flavodoxin domain-containing protein [Methanocaldococcus sp.]